MNIIQEATKSCDREDCRIVENVVMSTCMAWTPTFDKNGNRTDRGDPNITTWGIECLKCRKKWGCFEQYGITKLTSRDASNE